MKRMIGAVLAAVLLLSAVLCSCAPPVSKTPDQYKDIKWVTPDYSFRFDPDDDCKGNFTFGENKYNIQVKFEKSRVIVNDTDNDQILFDGDWMYEDGDHLYIYSVSYNTGDYEALKENYSEFFRLHQEKKKQESKEESKEESK